MSEYATISVAKGRIVLGLAACLLALGYLSLALELPWGTMDAPRSGMFPVFVAILTLIAALATVYDGVRGLGDKRSFDLPRGIHLVRAGAVFASLLFYALSLPTLGHLIASFVSAAIIVKALAGFSLIRTALYAGVIAAGTYIVFTQILAVPLPRGFLLL